MNERTFYVKLSAKGLTKTERVAMWEKLENLIKGLPRKTVVKVVTTEGTEHGNS
jgi:hypothetical protein